MNPFKKLSYKKNYYSKDIVKPLVFLCNKNLTRIGRLNPVNDLNISVNYNAADEISLSLLKYVQENKVFLYDKIEDLSVIEVKNGFDDESRYFEVGMDEKDTGAIIKSITGKELGYAELSQKLVTLEINTDADIARDDYVPTVLYNSDNKKGSLLDRLLSYAPDYEIGHVDDTVAGLQRTFSWSDTYMDACLNDICEELECIYTITVGLDENDKVIKRINIYDICYCKDCWDNMVNNKSTDMTKGDYWKNVLNGICQTCKGTNVYDVGVDTPILLNTKNFSDDISVQVDKDSIKNCFKLKAGDDTLTNIVEGALATSTNKIMMFSEDQTNKMSDELRAEWEMYYNKVNSSDTIKEYDNLTNLKYDIFDLVGFIKSSKMPTIDTDQGGLNDVYDTLINGLESYDYKFYTPSSLKFSKASSGSNAVKSLVAIYIGNGYSFLVDGDSTFNSSSPDLDNDSYYIWKGTVKVYKTDDRDTYFVLSAKENGIVVEFHYGKEGQVSTKATTGKFFKIYYGNKDLLSYKFYLDQQIKYTLHDNDVTEYDERDWSKYSIERLKSFYDGYEECLSMLDKMELTIEEEVGEVTADLLSGQKSIIEKLRKNYSAYIEDISKIMYLLEDQVFSLYYCLDSEQLAEQYPPLNNSQDYYYKLQMCSSVKEALDSLVNGYLIVLNVYNDDGSVGVGNNPQYVGSLSSPNHGVQCLNCGSTNLQYDRDYGRYYCANKGCTAGYKKVVTYFDYAKAIVEWFDNHFINGEYFSDIEDNIRKIQSDMYIRNNFTDNNYKELCSFIREDVYENSNYTSDNIADNTKLLETARKFVDRAKQQLAIACVPQISITATVSSLLVQSEIPNEELFDDFTIGNYIRVSIDDTVYKLRIIGIKYDFENLEKVEVTFSNVTKSLFGAMSDIQSILQQASSIATSFSSVAKQAENGQVAAQKFEHIKKEGLDSSLGSVKAAKNQEIVVDDHGILCRYYNKWLNQYDDRQLKIINQNIVMTDDAWENAKLAIGLGQYNGEAKWGVWADMLVGDLMITKDLKVINDESTVEINKDGIVLDGGKITWKKKLPSSSVEGLDDTVEDFIDAIDGLQSQIDGEITSWFEKYEPKTTNKPASLWTTDADKIRHEGDLFYNTATGAAYRYIYNSSTKNHEWSIITDEAISKALADAATAQDTADGKRRVFTSEPKPPYDIGDLWSQGDKGDIMVCVVTKLDEQTYSASDWAKASKYTDDTAFNEFVKGDYAKALKDINTQIDGKADTFYQSTKPHEEYTNVADNNTYNLYVGDLWYDTTTGKSYMYTKTANGSNCNYTWKFMDVPNDVYDTIDGIASIYVTIPSNPNEGDLLIPNSDIDGTKYKAGKVYKYNGSSWIEIKYTDDTAWKAWTSDTGDFGKYKKDIQTQLDGKSETTYGGSTPPSNPEKGDLWYCTDNSVGYDANKAYMYDGSVWQESNGVPDSVWDIADGKSSIFVTKPEKAISSVDSNFYHRNDLWILESDTVLSGHTKGTVMVATSDSTTFDATHWVEKVKYTDDTKANEVENTLTSYKSEIATFQKSVNNQLSTLNGAVPTTKIGENYIISPKIGGGYLYITKDGCSVEIDPARAFLSDNPKVINVQASNSDVFYVKRDGSAYFKGEITATSGEFTGKVTATSGEIQNGCKIGKWTIGSPSGSYSSQTGWLNCKTTYVQGGGISWDVNDEDNSAMYRTSMNGMNMELSKDRKLKIRFNSYMSSLDSEPNINTIDRNCIYADVGYINLNSTGNINLNSTGSGNMYLNTYNNGNIYLDTHNTAGSINFMSETHCNSNLILTKPYTKLAGYNNAQTACFDLVQLTEYTSGANHVRLGSEALNTEIYGASIYLKVSSAVYVNDVPVHGSDRNIKKEISSIDEKYDTFFNKLNPVTYKFIDGQSGRFHSGFISQEVEEALIQSGLTTNDFAGFVKYNDPKTNDEKYGLRYEEFISLNTHMIQQLRKKIEELEEKIRVLK